jgi:hypothetical protein
MLTSVILRFRSSTRTFSHNIRPKAIGGGFIDNPALGEW